MTEIQKVLANNIRKYRKQKGLTQIGLSNLCEISTNYIGLIETHRNFPSPKMIELIAKREGIGDLLAEGAARAAQKIGKGAGEFAMEVKGLEKSL